MSNAYDIQPDETRWQAMLRNALTDVGRNIRQDPIMGAPMLGYDALKAGASWLNEKPVKPAAPTALVDPLSFGTAKPSLTAAPVAVKPKAGDVPDITGFLAAHLGAPVQITSGYRDPKTNSMVGGSATSDHMSKFADGAPMAYDFKPQGMSTKDAAIKLATNLDGQYDQIIEEGDHVHVSFSPKGRGQVLTGNEKTGYKQLIPSAANGLQTIEPTVQPGDTTHFPSMLAMDPTQVGAMIPNARLLSTNVKMPKAPQQDMPADLTPMQGLDKASLLAPLQEALKVKPRDGTNDTWDRVSALLAGAARGATGASSTGGVGQLLLHAGAGAASGFKAEKMLQKGEQDKYDEMVRQANIALAQQGFQIDLKNVDVGNTNIERSDKSKEAKRVTKYSNATELFNAQMAKLQLDMGNARTNVGAENARDMQRAGAVIGATENQAEAQNKTNLGQTQLNIAGGGTAGLQKQIATSLTDVGMDPLDEKSPHAAPARQAAMGVHSNQIDSAFNGLAQDLVANGGAAELLAPAKGDSVEAAKMKAAALRQLKSAKKPGDATGVVQTLSQLFNSDHKAGVAAVKMFAARGYPSAKIILKGFNESGMTAEEKKAYGL